MNRWFGLLFIFFSVGFITACSSDEEDDPYPSLITEMVIFGTDGNSHTIMLTDNGVRYSVDYDLISLLPNTIVRAMCGYVPDKTGTAKIYTLAAVRILKDQTIIKGTLVNDPVGFVSSWKSGRFINLHLLPKTQANPINHLWGFFRDNQRVNSVGGTTYELSVYHEQGDDPMAYSSDVYLSLSIDSLSKTFGAKDSIELTIHGFDKDRMLRYGK